MSDYTDPTPQTWLQGKRLHAILWSGKAEWTWQVSQVQHHWRVKSSASNILLIMQPQIRRHCYYKYNYKYLLAAKWNDFVWCDSVFNGRLYEGVWSHHFIECINSNGLCCQHQRQVVKVMVQLESREHWSEEHLVPRDSIPAHVLQVKIQPVGTPEVLWSINHYCQCTFDSHSCKLWAPPGRGGSPCGSRPPAHWACGSPRPWRWTPEGEQMVGLKNNYQEMAFV